jgi:hypothetical protein
MDFFAQAAEIPRLEAAIGVARSRADRHDRTAGAAETLHESRQFAGFHEKV